MGLCADEKQILIKKRRAIECLAKDAGVSVSEMDRRAVFEMSDDPARMKFGGGLEYSAVVYDPTTSTKRGRETLTRSVCFGVDAVVGASQ